MRGWLRATPEILILQSVSVSDNPSSGLPEHGRFTSGDVAGKNRRLKGFDKYRHLHCSKLDAAAIETVVPLYLALPV